ncbi:hypothetical protein BJY04DRAFT_192530 [Aspergillus karnatakaensis]|uniref:uncharacterized protein n=1 Tax=Aspergillus karnatakaensis TaxID=1810916 RepID=UPI003CCD95E7
MTFCQASSRSNAVLVLIHLAGLSYFLFFISSFLLYHFPTSPEVIYEAQVTVGCAFSFPFKDICFRFPTLIT